METILFNLTIQAEILKVTCHYSIIRQVMTGRSSLEWDNSLKKANPQKLLIYVNKHGGSVDEDIIATTRYLKRYCNYKES